MAWFADLPGRQVKYVFCPTAEEYEKDDRKQKLNARKMIKLGMDMKARKTEYFKATVKENAIQCAMCHRGKHQPEAFVPWTSRLRQRLRRLSPAGVASAPGRRSGPEAR